MRSFGLVTGWLRAGRPGTGTLSGTGLPPLRTVIRGVQERPNL